MNYKNPPLAMLLPSIIFMSCISCSNNTSLNRATARLNDTVSEQFYNVMAGEIYNKMGNNKQSIEHYLRVAMKSKDPAIAKRATQIAANTQQNNKALQVARRWLELAPKSVEARQYVSLLLLRQKQPHRSAQQLHKAQLQLDQQGDNGIEQIAIKLSSERNTEQVYQTYKAYQKLEPKSIKVQLVLSSFAFKAQHYEEALANITPLSTQAKGELKEQILLLQSKILYKLNRNSEAMQVLSPLMRSKSTTDIALLEYVRLLIMEQRNKEAAAVLLRLSRKYPDNLDISKGLVSLYIDLEDYIQAEKHIPLLLQSVRYKSTAHHFKAQIYESRHEFDAALNEYAKVNDGQLYDSAQGRIPFLLEQQQGLNMAREWLHQKISNEKLTAIKVKFLNIEGNLLLDKHQYHAALKLFNEADTLTPNNIDTHHNKAITLQKIKQQKETISNN